MQFAYAEIEQSCTHRYLGTAHKLMKGSGGRAWSGRCIPCRVLAPLASGLTWLPKSYDDGVW